MDNAPITKAVIGAKCSERRLGAQPGNWIITLRAHAASKFPYARNEPRYCTRGIQTFAHGANFEGIFSAFKTWNPDCA